MIKEFSVSVALMAGAIIATGCATSGVTGLTDFNSKFGLEIPASPLYKIEPVGRNRYQIQVYQGAALISERTARSAYLSKAAMIAMDRTCQEKHDGELGAYQFNSEADSMGFMNLMGFFSCATKPN